MQHARAATHACSTLPPHAARSPGHAARCIQNEAAGHSRQMETRLPPPPLPKRPPPHARTFPPNPPLPATAPSIPTPGMENISTILPKNLAEVIGERIDGKHGRPESMAGRDVLCCKDSNESETILDTQCLITCPQAAHVPFSVTAL